MKLFHCVVVMGAAMTGGCGGATSTGGRTTQGDGPSTDATASSSPGSEAGGADDAFRFTTVGGSDAGPPDDAAGSLALAQDASEAGADRASCCGDAGADGEGPCFNYSTFPGRQWSCLSYEPPTGCTCNVVVAIL